MGSQTGEKPPDENPEREKHKNTKHDWRIILGTLATIPGFITIGWAIGDLLQYAQDGWFKFGFVPGLAVWIGGVMGIVLYKGFHRGTPLSACIGLSVTVCFLCVAVYLYRGNDMLKPHLKAIIYSITAVVAIVLVIGLFYSAHRIVLVAAKEMVPAVAQATPPSVIHPENPSPSAPTTAPSDAQAVPASARVDLSQQPPAQATRDEKIALLGSGAIMAMPDVTRRLRIRVATEKTPENFTIQAGGCAITFGLDNNGNLIGGLPIAPGLKEGSLNIMPPRSLCPIVAVITKGFLRLSGKITDGRDVAILGIDTNDEKLIDILEMPPTWDLNQDAFAIEVVVFDPAAGRYLPIFQIRNGNGFAMLTGVFPGVGDPNRALVVTAGGAVTHVGYASIRKSMTDLLRPIFKYPSSFRDPASKFDGSQIEYSGKDAVPPDWPPTSNISIVNPTYGPPLR